MECGVTKKTPMVLLTGPSNCGKTSTINFLAPNNGVFTTAECVSTPATDGTHSCAAFADKKKRYLFFDEFSPLDQAEFAYRSKGGMSWETQKLLFGGHPFDVAVPKNISKSNVTVTWTKGAVATCESSGLWCPTKPFNEGQVDPLKNRVRTYTLKHVIPKHVRDTCEKALCASCGCKILLGEDSFNNPPPAQPKNDQFEQKNHQFGQKDAPTSGTQSTSATQSPPSKRRKTADNSFMESLRELVDMRRDNLLIARAALQPTDFQFPVLKNETFSSPFWTHELTTDFLSQFAQILPSSGMKVSSSSPRRNSCEETDSFQFVCSLLAHAVTRNCLYLLFF